jgi:hypothetical protein
MAVLVAYCYKPALPVATLAINIFWPVNVFIGGGYSKSENISLSFFHDKGWETLL